MSSLSRFSRCLGYLAVVLTCCFAAISLQAQQQEEGILTKIKAGKPANADAFAFAGADKSFAVSSAIGNRQARVKSFAFSSKSSLYGGDGKFRSKTFNPGNDSFNANSYAGVKASQVSQRNSFAQGDKLFATKAMDVREAPAANKSMSTRDFILPTRPYEWKGKRQGSLDEIYRNNPNLSIDQVRDLLNKGPVGRP